MNLILYFRPIAALRLRQRTMLAIVSCRSPWGAPCIGAYDNYFGKVLHHGGPLFPIGISMPSHGVWPGRWPLVSYLLFLPISMGIAILRCFKSRYLEEFSQRTWQDPAACLLFGKLPLFLPLNRLLAARTQWLEYIRTLRVLLSVMYLIVSSLDTASLPLSENHHNPTLLNYDKVNSCPIVLKI
jgi:hypothetical protein